VRKESFVTKRVLIVEDSSTIRDQLRRILTPEGFDVLEARDGLEGLEMAREHDDVAIMVCDVNMPRMDGIAMITVLRSEGNETPVLMLTTEGEPELIVQAKKAGARAWIIKPFDERLLVKAIKGLTDQGGANA
jgi:two-component system chemotaxis response regulator CheY